MKRPGLRWILLLVAGLWGLFLLVGGYNISATSGHFHGVPEVLEFTMRNSVHWRASEEPPGNLGDPALIRRGAGAFEDGCRLCHAMPGHAINPISAAMVPPPPPIEDAIRDWTASELFLLVRDGIKMTGMPAWPAPERDDEVWAVVAFLLAVPELETRDYERLVRPEINRGVLDEPGLSAIRSDILVRCSACHGNHGEDTGQGAFPLLNMLHPDYLEASLLAYRDGTRPSGIMAPQVANLGNRELRLLAEHFGNTLAATATPDTRDPPDAGNDEYHRARQLVETGDAKQRIPACSACHHPAGYPQSDRFPHLEGQPRAYIRQQLELFRAGHRGGSAFAPLMTLAAKYLSDDDIEALARYYGKAPDPAASASSR